MKTRGLVLKLAQVAPPLSVATAAGPVFAMLDPPGVEDAHGDTMDAGALYVRPGVTEVPLYWMHSYHPGVVPEAMPHQRLPVGSAVVWQEGAQWYFTPRFNPVTELAEQVRAAVERGEITACSIGYLSEEATPNGKGEDVHRAPLIEVSLVDKGAKEGAVRIKQMDPEKKPPEDDVQAQFKAMAAQVKDLHDKVNAIHGKMFPPEQEKPAEETKAEPPPAPEQDPVTKWLGSLAAKSA